MAVVMTRIILVKIMMICMEVIRAPNIGIPSRTIPDRMDFVSSPNNMLMRFWRKMYNPNEANNNISEDAFFDLNFRYINNSKETPKIITNVIDRKKDINKGSFKIIRNK
jgi:hypothetical protein